MAEAPEEPASGARLAVSGGFGGLMSGLLGLGGGVVVVPMLLLFVGLRQRRAVALSLMAIVPISVVGLVSYLARGSVDLRLGAALLVGAIPGGRLGAWLLPRADEVVLELVLGLVLVAAALATVLR